jgi:hypothetical protein
MVAPLELVLFALYHPNEIVSSYIFHPNRLAPVGTSMISYIVISTCLYMGLLFVQAVAGLLADAKQIVETARIECSNYRNQYGSNIPLKVRIILGPPTCFTSVLFYC